MPGVNRDNNLRMEPVFIAARYGIRLLGRKAEQLRRDAQQERYLHLFRILPRHGARQAEPPHRERARFKLHALCPIVVGPARQIVVGSPLLLENRKRRIDLFAEARSFPAGFEESRGLE